MKENNRLISLALSVFLPAIGILTLAVVGLFHSQRTIETLARSYVEGLTEGVASRLESRADFWWAFGEDARNVDRYDGKLGLRSFVGLGRLPGLIVVLDDRGAFLYGSSRIRELVGHSGTEFPIGIAKELYDAAGDKYTVAVFPASQGHYLVIGALPWRDLPGAAMRAAYLWPALFGLAGLWSALTLWRLWKSAIRPLGELELEMSQLKWGEEIPSKGPTGTAHELRKLRLAFSRAAQEAINKVHVIRSCMKDLVSVQEEERTKISRDIHDGPLQDVTALIQRIHLAKSPDNTPEETTRQLDLAEKIALATVKEMRGLCDFLNPPWLDLGLEQALTELTERQSAQYGVRIFLDVEEDICLIEGVTQAFFRVVQEAVTNSVRHGEAKNIWVDVKQEGGVIELCVQDDGVGFDMHQNGTAALRVEGHRGLSNMEERLALVGGRLEILSYPGEGTCIRGLIP